MTVLDRRAFVSYFAASGLTSGLTSGLLPGVLWAESAGGTKEITTASIAAAEELIGLTFTEEQRIDLVEGLKRHVADMEKVRSVQLGDVMPAVHFNPVLPNMKLRPPTGRSMHRSKPTIRARPQSESELAFLPVTELSELIRTRKVSSLELTQLYLARLKKYDPVLLCVVNLTEERALTQARAADAELARGKYRGPLHGIPWGAKDLLAIKGTPTTWGSDAYRSQVIDQDATVVQRLDAAGAVHVAKLSLGELAAGDNWFRGFTRNPWKTDKGSSGSSAGPGSATSAGLVGFSVGSETAGSIVSPSTVCGVTGMRPSFGRIPRTGAMALVWSMDKLGPMCRSVEDCALVFDAIHGPDGQDPGCHAADFVWDARVKPKDLRIGYAKSAFEGEKITAFDRATLDVLKGMGVNLIPVEFPGEPVGLSFIVMAESAAAFDELTRSGRDAQLTEKGKNGWGPGFRGARFIPAVEYLNMNRARMLLMRQWAELMSRVDVIVTPTGARNEGGATNLTGHPVIALPNGFKDDGTPVSITFVGGLYEEAKLLAVAHAYQQKTSFHLKHPPFA